MKSVICIVDCDNLPRVKCLVKAFAQAGADVYFIASTDGQLKRHAGSGRDDWNLVEGGDINVELLLIHNDEQALAEAKIANYLTAKCVLFSGGGGKGKKDWIWEPVMANDCLNASDAGELLAWATGSVTHEPRCLLEGKRPDKLVALLILCRAFLWLHKNNRFLGRNADGKRVGYPRWWQDGLQITPELTLPTEDWLHAAEQELASGRLAADGQQRVKLLAEVGQFIHGLRKAPDVRIDFDVIKVLEASLSSLLGNLSDIKS